MGHPSNSFPYPFLTRHAFLLRLPFLFGNTVLNNHLLQRDIQLNASLTPCYHCIVYYAFATRLLTSSFFPCSVTLYCIIILNYGTPRLPQSFPYPLLTLQSLPYTCPNLPLFCIYLFFFFYVSGSSAGRLSWGSVWYSAPARHSAGKCS